MILGITEKEQKIIDEILAEHKNDYKFYAYGSRVKGTHTQLSDLDILIKGSQEMPFDILEELKHKFDNSSLPYVVNFSDYHKIDTNFYQQIEKDLTLIYPRP